MSSEDFKHAPGALASIDNQGNLPLCTGFAVAKENYENTANIFNPDSGVGAPEIVSEFRFYMHVAHWVN